MLLRQYRLRSRLTQEALAERAGISSRSVGEMERGRGRSPRPRTVEQLATALRLEGAERDEFLAAGRDQFWANRSGSRDRPTAADPSGDRRPAADDDAFGAVRLRPRQLPADLADFVGRDAELALLTRLLEPATSGPALVAVSGPPGVGKTALAVHIGHLMASVYPDGQLYAELREPTGAPADPYLVLAHMLRALGVAGSSLPQGLDARAALFRATLAGRRVLMVLDDAQGHRQVEPLLPGEGGAVVLTSRLPLTGLPGVTTVDLPPLGGPAAVELLSRVAGSERVRDEPAATDQLVAACGGLPLAVRIAGARLAARPHWSVSTLSRRLADERSRLDELRHGDLDLRAGLHIAYQGLSRRAARGFALLGALDVPSFPEWTVATMLDVDAVAGSRVLEELLDARLLDDLGPDQAGQRRYRFHDVTRLYARERRDTDVDRDEAADALRRGYAGWQRLAYQARQRLHCERFHLCDHNPPSPHPDPVATAVAAQRPVAWFEAEREALAAVVSGAATAGWTGIARCLAGCCAEFYELRGYYDDWREAMQVALAACRRTGDRPGEAAMLRGLGTCLVELDDLPAALWTLRSARKLAADLDEPLGVALATKDIGFVLSLSGQLGRAEVELRDAADKLGEAGRYGPQAQALTSLGFVVRQQGRPEQAVTIVRSAIDIAVTHGDTFSRAYASRGLAGALLGCGDARAAERAAAESVILFDEIADPIGAAQGMRVLAEAIARHPDRLCEAERVLANAAGVFRVHGHRWGQALAELSLGEVGVRRGADEAVGRLRRSLAYWERERVPALQARCLVALGTAAEQAGDPEAPDLLLRAYRIYQDLDAPEAAGLAARLGLSSGHAAPPAGSPPE